MFLALNDQPDASTIITSLPIAYAIADFVNGVYSYNASTVALSAVITDESPSVVTASGLHLIAGHSAIPFVSNFYTALFTFNWTLLFDLQTTSDHKMLLDVGHETVTFGYQNECYIEIFDDTDWYAEDDNGDYPGTPPGTGSPQQRFVEAFPIGGPGPLHKLGVTRTNSLLSLSIDGFPVQTLATPVFSINAPAGGSTDVGAVIGADRFGGTVDNSFYLRKFQIFDPVSNAVLVALTGA